MPPRFAYWTIILDGTPTSFRAREREELLPTFNQLKKKDPTAMMKWFSGGTLWDSPEQASEKRRLDREARFNQTRSREERRREEFPREGQPVDRQPHQSPPADGRFPDRRPHQGPPAEGRFPDRRPHQSPPAEGRFPDRRPHQSPPRVGRPSGDRLLDVRVRDERRQDARPGGTRPAEQPVPSTPPETGEVVRKPRTLPRLKSSTGATGLPARPKGWRPGGEHRHPKDKYKLPPGEARKRWKKRNLGPGKPK